MFKSFGFINNLFVALKTKFGKAVFFFKIVFVTTIYMFLFITNIDIIELKNVLVN